MNDYGVPQSMLDELEAAEKAVDEIRSRINKAALANLDVTPGEIMVHKFNGLRYKVEGFHAYPVRGDGVRISISARRYYQSGRREGRTARSASFVSFSDLEKISK
jgi:hypothetical protein